MTWTYGKEEFVRESNRIENIHRAVTREERAAHEALWALPSISVEDLEQFVTLVAGAELRRSPGMDVRVGSHIPLAGGPWIEERLKTLLGVMHADQFSPYETHVMYETLHPFMDGNGRSGRALWAWQMTRLGGRPFDLGFLHTFYYQALDASRREQ